MQTTTLRISRNGKATTLLKKLAKLPPKEQIEIHFQLGLLLTKRSQKPARLNKARAPKNDFLESEFGRYIVSDADDRISIEKVRKALSQIPGSLAEEINREREERG